MPDALTAWDWAVLALYALVLIGSGLWLSLRAQKGGRDYFLAGGSIPAWAAAMSLVATALSAATFIGGPEQAFRGDLTYLSASIGGLLGVGAVAIFFIPAFYRERVTTVYELLERRMGVGARRASSAMFMLGRILASGARIYIAAIPLALLLYGDLTTSGMISAVAMLTVVAVAYTLFGGVRSVIWSDVIQTIVFVGAAGAAIWLLLDRIPAPVSEILDGLREPAPDAASKLTVIDVAPDLTKNYTLWSALIGWTLFNMAAYGADHDLAQRMLTCKTAARGGASAIGAILIGIPITALFMIIGLLLFVFYQRPDLMGDAAPLASPDDTRTTFLNYILNETPAGLRGLMMAGLFAAGLSSLNSALNAMASTFVNDWYIPLRGRTTTPEDEVRIGRRAVLGWAVVLGAVASGCVAIHDPEKTSLIDFALGVMTLAYGGLLGVFLTAIFTKRGNNVSAIAALAVGTASIVIFSVTESWLAFPWRMAISVGAAFIVCLAGARRPEAAHV